MKKKTVLITGCTKGIGHAITKSLLAHGGYTIYGIGRDPETSDLKGLAGIKLYACDLEKSHDVERTLQNVLDDSKGIDIVINNAGVGNFKPIDQLSLADWNIVLAVNLTAPYLVMRYV